MARAREHWGTRAGFILAVSGSMIGLGNIWRFPSVAYESGGGAFLIPYLVALLTAGIPLVILEFTIGHKGRGSAPGAMRKIIPGGQIIGWWQVAIAFVVSVYYAVIIAWGISYIGFSVSLQWGGDPKRFLNENVLNLAHQPGWVSEYVPGVMWPLIAVWVITLGILAFGVRRGIELSNKIFVPLLVLFFVLLGAYALTLPGAINGIHEFFRPDWSAIGSPSVWLAAYGQVFFSLSLGFGIMITYATYVRKKSDLTGSAMVTAFANSSFEILAGIVVFAALGFMATNAGLPISDVVDGGPGLTFVVFPEIISTLPTGAHLFGVLFFTSLVLAGLTSLVSIVEVVIAAVQDRFNMSRIPAVIVVGALTAGTSLFLFPTSQGFYLLDIVDHFINMYGIVPSALVTIIATGWFVWKLPRMAEHANAISAVKIGRSWMIALGGVTPIVLAWSIVESVRGELLQPYGNYSIDMLTNAGWLVAVGVIVFGIIASVPAWRTSDEIDVIQFQKGRR